VALFAESTSRALVAVRPENVDAFAGLCGSQGVPHTPVGATSARGDVATLEIAGHVGERGAGVDESSDVTNGAQFSVTLADLRTTWSATLPAALT
ncbi:MAG: hypothetical protein WAK18_11445, partial [Nocardioidaceae bacterium]